MEKEIDELRHEVKELREDKIRRDGFTAGVKAAFKHTLYACALLWSFVTFMVSMLGDLAYNNIPVVKQIVDIINGVK